MKKLLCFVLVLVSLSAFAQEGHIQSYPRYPGSFSDPLLFLEVEKGTRSFRLSLQAFKDSSGVSTATQTALNGKADKISAVDLEIADSTKGVILRSPNGIRWRLTVNNNGSLTLTAQ